MYQPDFFNINPEVDPEKEKISLEQQFTNERLEWSAKIESMSKQMKLINTVGELMTEVYTERQRCLEYYHYLISKLIIINRQYRKRYNERLDYWTFKSQIRYPNETSKNNKILTELADLVQRREMVENHSKYILDSKNTIDNLIYAIPKRIDLEKMAKGII